jgi:hypothetical protein
MVGYPFTDEVSHQFMGLVSPTDAGRRSEPVLRRRPKFARRRCSGRSEANRVAIREEYIRSAYQDADEKLGITRALMGGDPTTFAGPTTASRRSGMRSTRTRSSSTRPSSRPRAAPGVPATISLHASNANASNCGAATTDLAKACWAGGTIQIYVNTTLPAGVTYAQVRTAIREAFQAVTDPANPGKQVILKIMNKEELRDVDGSDSLHPNRSGDVVVVTRPPYQSDAGTNGVAIALSHFFGQHGYLPNTVDLANNINMHGTFVMSGPGVRNLDTKVPNLRAIDIAPTLALLMNIPGPAECARDDPLQHPAERRRSA